MTTSKELREKRANIAEQMKELVSRTRDADHKQIRPFTPEENQQFDRMNEELDSSMAQIETLERCEKFEAISTGTKPKTEVLERSHLTSDYTPLSWDGQRGNPRPGDGDKALRSWLSGKFLGHSKGQPDKSCRETLQRNVDFNSDSTKRYGADLGLDTFPIELYPEQPRSRQEILQRSSNGQSTQLNYGGEFIPTLLAQQIEIYLLAWTNILQVCRVWRTDNGDPVNIPYSDDTSNQSTIITEATQDTVLDIPTNKKSIGMYMLTSGLIYLSLEWALNSKYPVQQFISEQLGVRHARGSNYYFTLGSGSGQPQGVVSGTAISQLTSTTTVVTYTDLLNLIYQVPAAYRDQPTFAIMGSDTFVKACRNITTTTGLPLWVPSLQTGAADTLLGHPFLPNYYMAAMGGVNAKVAIAGDFNQFLCRVINNVELVVDPYTRKASNRQIIMALHGAIDSQFINPAAFAVLGTPSASSITGP